MFGRECEQERHSSASETVESRKDLDRAPERLSERLNLQVITGLQ